MSKRKRKKWCVLLCILLAAIGLSACEGQSSDGGDAVTIAYIGPLTGEAAAWGQPELNTLRIMVDQINEEGGILGKTLVLKSYDNRNDNVETTNAARKAIQNDRVCAIIGCNASGTSLALANVCEEFQIPQISTTGTNSKVTVDDTGSVRPWTFRVCLADPQLGEIMADYAFEQLGYRNIAILYEVSSDYSAGIAENFIASFEASGGTITTLEAYKTGDVDFRAQLASIKQSQPEALFLPMTYKELGLALKQARSLGIEQQFLGPDCWQATDLFDVAKEEIQGSVFVAPVDGSDPALDEFKAWYKEMYDGEDPAPAGANAYFAYDALAYLTSAIERAESAEPAAIRDALETLRDVEGLTGTITMIPENHNPIRSANIFLIEGEEFKSISKFTVEY